jgi:hypothetical protein
MALKVRRYESLQSATGNPVRVPIPRGGRILWLLDKTGPFYKELCPALCTGEGQYVVYTDLPARGESTINVLGFEFTPETAGEPASPPSAPRGPEERIEGTRRSG